ncbi:small multi-drug export protein [Marinilabiliaceae bacterium ANBcel2]|nr:small multi-drug export protein [Marinilabiliaceae bacterium ANBcel2]
MLEYIIQAVSVWFISFIPAFEIFVAIPAGVGMGLDPISLLLFSVSGNLAPLFIIDRGEKWILSITWIRKRVTKPISPKTKKYINRYGIWYVLLITPWTGIWLMGATSKAFQMKNRAFIWSASISIFLYAAIIIALIHLGIYSFSSTS